MTDASLDPVKSGDIIGARYQVVERLGEGGMGVLYLALDQRAANRRVVLKFPKKNLLFTEGFRLRFDQEIKQLIFFEHPNVVRVYDVGVQNDFPYMVLQYLPGGSLADKIAKDGLRTPTELLQWLPRIAAALDSLHRQGTIHRDVKAANILFDSHGEPYLSDFGIVKVLTDLDSHGTLTGGGIGSPESLAPEYIERNFTGAYDQYGLGTTVYQAVSGRLPFQPRNADELQIMIVTQPPAPLMSVAPNAGKEFSDVVMKALSKKPSQRYGTCAAFVAALIEAVWARPQEPELAVGRTMDAPEADMEIPTPHSQNQPGKAQSGEAELDAKDAPKGVDSKSSHARGTGSSGRTTTKMRTVFAGLLLVIFLVPLFVRLSGRHLSLHDFLSSPTGGPTAPEAPSRSAAAPTDIPASSVAILPSTTAERASTGPSSGYLAISSDLPARILIDGQQSLQLQAGETKTVQLIPGEHVVQTRSTDGGYSCRRTVLLSADRQTAVQCDLSVQKRAAEATKKAILQQQLVSDYRGRWHSVAAESDCTFTTILGGGDKDIVCSRTCSQSYNLTLRQGSDSLLTSVLVEHRHTSESSCSRYPTVENKPERNQDTILASSVGSVSSDKIVILYKKCDGCAQMPMQLTVNGNQLEWTNVETEISAPFLLNLRGKPFAFVRE